MSRKRGQPVWRSVAELVDLVRQGGAAISVRALGLEALASAEVCFQHVGPVEYQNGVRKLRRFRIEELKRIAREQRELLEAGCKAEDHPHLFPGTILRGADGEPLADGDGKVIRSREIVEGEARTPEGEELLQGVIRAYLEHTDGATGRPMLLGLRGFGPEVDGEAGAEGAPATSEQVAELERLGLLELCLPAALEVQSPEPSFRPADAGAGVAKPE